MATAQLGLGGLSALVLASSRGLGYAAARAIAVGGARVMMAASSEQVFSSAAAVEEEAAAHGGTALPILCDVTDDMDVRRAVEATVAEFGGLNIVVANAGGPPPGTFASVSLDDWERGHRLSLMSVVHVARHAVPVMALSGGGSITAIQ